MLLLIKKDINDTMFCPDYITCDNVSINTIRSGAVISENVFEPLGYVINIDIILDITINITKITELELKNLVREELFVNLHQSDIFISGKGKIKLPISITEGKVKAQINLIPPFIYTTKLF